MFKNILPLIIIFIVIGLGMLGAVTYFRGDDFLILQIGGKYKNDIFTLLFKTYIGGYRPINWLIELLEYKLFKLNSTGYQLFISVIFAIAMVYLYKLSKLLRGVTAGFISFLCFIFYYPSLSTIWWRANIGFAIYLVFLGAALVYGIKGLKETKINHCILAITASIFALLNYEFALMIIPILIIYAYLYRKQIKNKLKAFVFLSILFSSILIVLFISQSFVEKSIILDRVRITRQMLYNLDYWLINSASWFSFYLLLLASIGLHKKLFSKIAVFLYGIVAYLIFKESIYIVFIPTIFILRFIFGANEERFAITIAVIGMLFVSTLAIPWQLIGLIRYPLFFWYGISIFMALGLTNLVKQLANNFEDNKKYKIVLQYAMVAPLFILGTFQTIKNDFIEGKNELLFLRDQTHANRESAFYLKNTITSNARVIYLNEPFDYDFIFNYFNPNPGAVIDVSPKRIIWDSSFLNDIDKIYIVGNTALIAKLFPEMSTRDTYLDGVFNICFGRDVNGSAIVLNNNGLSIRKYDENAVHYESAGYNKQASVTYLINSDKPQMWISIIMYPRIVYSLEDSFCKILYSIDGEKWEPTIDYGGRGLFPYWTPIWGSEVRKNILIPNNKAYIKIILKNGQLWSGLEWPSWIIVNNRRGRIFEGMLIKDKDVRITRYSENNDTISFKVKLVKEYLKDLYGISILKCSR